MKKFSSFLIVDLFSIKKGNQKNMNALESGSTPLVSAKKIDNGYKDFVTIDGKDVISGHCITLNNDGDGGAGLAFYQPVGFALDTHVTALHPKTKMSKFQLLYISNCISKQRVLFGHGHSINSSRITHLTCMLPVDDKGLPDYEYMDNYMKTVEKKMLKSYRDYLSSTNSNNSSDNNLKKGNTSHFSEFRIGSLFSIKRPAARSITNYDEGDTCFIASGAVNNGVLRFVRPHQTEQLDKGHCLTVSPVDGSCFYHTYDFLGRGGAGSSILLLYPVHKISSRALIYISKAINHTTSKYSYGRMATKESITNDIILLPVSAKGCPDYAYMEQYMKNKEQCIINRYIDYRINHL